MGLPSQKKTSSRQRGADVEKGYEKRPEKDLTLLASRTGLKILPTVRQSVGGGKTGAASGRYPRGRVARSAPSSATGW